MLLHIEHTTRYKYTPAVETAQHIAHLKPRDTASQQLLQHQLSVTPTPAQRQELVDGYGNTRSFFALQTTHHELSVVADSLVNTQVPDTPSDSPAWEQVREQFRYRAGGPYDSAAEFVFASPYVPRHEDFLSYAKPSFATGTPLLVAARDLMARIHEDFEYKTASTDINTPTLQAMTMRKGVCQDFAHIMVACLRALGLPARYVSGYLLTAPPPGQPRLVGSDASHAWVSIYLPGGDAKTPAPGQWCDLDPTNNRAPGEDYVTLAHGRDYSDVSPLRGVIHGGARHTLTVAVTVEPVLTTPTIEQIKEKP